MAKVNDIENAKINYDYSLLQKIILGRNYIYIKEEESASYLGKSIKLAMKGSYTGEGDIDQIKPTLVRHFSKIGYYCRIGSIGNKKYAEIWKPDLLLHKPLYWSLFEDGFAIPVSMQKEFDKAIGKHLNKGDQILIKLIIKGKDYTARLVNINSKSKSDQYQVRYDGNDELINILIGHFYEQYEQIKSEKANNKNSNNSKKTVVYPGDCYIEVFKTSEVNVFELRLSPVDFYQYDDTLSNSDIELVAKSLIASRTISLSGEDDEKNRIERIKNYHSDKANKRLKTSVANNSNPILKEDIKQLYRYECQICSTVIKCRGWIPGLTKKEELLYLSSDAHHIIPLKDGGPDHPRNIICICPNCHRRLHSGEYIIRFINNAPICIDAYKDIEIPVRCHKEHLIIDLKTCEI